jgi:hypothetical protein
MTMNWREELKSMVTTGPASDIYKAEQALKLSAVVGESADAVNVSTFSHLFSTVQGYATEQFVLAINRLLEPQKRYALLSLPGVLAFLGEHAADLPLEQPTFLEQAMKRQGLWSDEIRSATGPDQTKAVADALQSKLPVATQNAALNALKALRDKRIAHPENISAEAIPRTTWEEAEKLLVMPRQAVSVCGAYFSMAYTDNEGRYFMTTDAGTAGYAMRRLFKELGIIKKEMLQG